MITKIQIENFRSCENVLLKDLGSLVALIGRNGVGKTNVLRAVVWMARMATVPDFALQNMSWIYTDTDYKKPPRVSIDVKVGNDLYSYSITQAIDRAKDATKKASTLRISLKESIQRASNGGEPIDIIAREGTKITSPLRKEPISINALTGALRALTSILPKDDPLITAVSPLLNVLVAIRYYPLDEPSDPFRDGANAGRGWVEGKSHSEWLTQYTNTGHPDDSVEMRIIHMSQADPEHFDELKQWLGKDALGLIDEIFVTKYPQKPDGNKDSDSKKQPDFWLISFRPSCGAGDNQKGVGYSDLSTGTRRIIRLLSSMIFDKSEVMLLEHPEDGIHSGLVSKLIGLLRSNVGTKQAIVSSHSLTILNSLAPKELRLVTMTNGKTSVRSLKSKEIRVASKYIANEGTLGGFVGLIEGD